MRPIQARPGQQLDVAAVDARVHAVAVVLDLVQPAVARRRLVYQARELRLDPFWRPRCRSHAVEWSISSRSMAMEASGTSPPCHRALREPAPLARVTLHRLKEGGRASSTPSVLPALCRSCQIGRSFAFRLIFLTWSNSRYGRTFALLLAVLGTWSAGGPELRFTGCGSRLGVSQRFVRLSATRSECLEFAAVPGGRTWISPSRHVKRPESPPPCGGSGFLTSPLGPDAAVADCSDARNATRTARRQIRLRCRRPRRSSRSGATTSGHT